MPSTRVTQEERERVLANIRPIGSWRNPRERKPFGNPATPWEAKLGNLDEWRAHPGQGKAIVKILKDPLKTQAIRTSVQNRLRSLYPTESWTTFEDGGYICLKFGGMRRSYVTAQSQPNQEDDDQQDDDETQKKEGPDNPEDELFAQTG